MEDHIRPLFLRLGFNFRGFWTNDPSSLKIVYRDSSMVEKQARQNVNVSRHYQQVVPVRDDVQTYLRVQRKDRKDIPDNGNSSVILTSRNGGFAMEQYVLQGEKTLLNMNRFIKSALFYDNGYQKGMSIERVDGDKNYEPANCKFINRDEQQKNKRNTIKITIGGQTKILSEWCKVYKVNRNTIKSRVDRGMSYQEALAAEGQHEQSL